MFHILLTTSPEPYRLFQTEMLIRSLKLFGEIDFQTTLIITSQNKKGSDDLHQLIPGKINNEYLDKNCEILMSNANYRTHPPVRWFVEPRERTCIFLDTDVLACSKIQFQPCGKFWGMIAHASPFNMKQWQRFYKECGVEFPGNIYTNLNGEHAPYYVNFGVLIVPKDHVIALREVLPKNIKKANIFSQNNIGSSYYGSQIGLAVSISELKLPYGLLPLKYNYPDFPIYDKKHKNEMNNVVFYHYLRMKHIIRNESTVKQFIESIPTEPSNYLIPWRILKSIFQQKKELQIV